jgi:hypothetical protein
MNRFSFETSVAFSAMAIARLEFDERQLQQQLRDLQFGAMIGQAKSSRRLAGTCGHVRGPAAMHFKYVDWESSMGTQRV